jgi:hypothetical protein
LRTPERFAGAREIPEFTIGTPAGVFSIFELLERIEDTREFQSTLAGFLTREMVAVFMV